MNNIIGNKMFTYIDDHRKLTQTMVDQYNDSLIFIKDEKQIFVPKINTYIGLGTTAYEALKSEIQHTNANLVEYNNYIHHDLVNNIYVQFSPEQIEGKTIKGLPINSQSLAYSYLKANRNIILKGLNDYNLGDGNLDEAGYVVPSVNTSGITINIEHKNSNIRTAQYTLGGTTYYAYYFDPYDTITIDDTKTWAYITASNSYMINFVEKFSSQQANRIYKDLMGISTVYIEKEFEEAFNYNVNNGKIELFDDVYVKQTNGQYAKVSVSDDGKSIKLNTDIIYSIDPSATVANIINILSPDGGYETISQGNSNASYPIWYHLDDSSSNTYNMNIADGIQTLKEVAYILDVITNGNDTGISLAYNISYNYEEIQKIKEWQTNIGNESVSSFQSKSSNDLLTVDYYSLNQWNDRNTYNGSTGHVELDINLIMAQTYTLNGATYAAYLTNHNGANKYNYILSYDLTDNSNYHQTSNADIINDLKNAYQAIYGHLDPNDRLSVLKKENGEYTYTSSTVVINSLQTTSVTGNNYIYLPYKKVEYDFTKGLTDVKWVTTYVGWLADDINNRINSTQTDSYSYIIDRINDLDVSGSKQPGQYVSYVTQTNGYIFAYQEKLPVDIFSDNTLVWGSYSFIHVTKDYLATHASDQYYTISGNKFVTTPTPNVTNYDYYPDLYARVPSSANMIALNTNDPNVTLTTLITNAGNTSYYWKRLNLNNTYSYIPLDLQSAYTDGEAFNNNLTIKTANTYFYLAQPGEQVKYVDVNYTQRENGSTLSFVNVNITYLSSSSEKNSGLADAYDVRRTIESMFKWVNLNTNEII